MPDIFAELGEFMRVGELFDIDSSTLMLVAREEGRLLPLNEVMWQDLENSDSYGIPVGGWTEVAKNSAPHQRDYEDLREKLETGREIDAPIIVKYQRHYHLVAGNTRLMVARALGLRPEIWLFEVFDNETGL